MQRNRGKQQNGKDQRSLQENWRYQGNISCKDEHNKGETQQRPNRNGKDLTEAEEIKKKWQESTEELYKKDFYDPDNHDGVITHLEPDILEYEVKWTLGSIELRALGRITTNNASGGVRIPGELS